MRPAGRAARIAALTAAVARRQRWRIEEDVRGRLWPDRWGFEPRRLPPVAVTLPARPVAAPSYLRLAGTSGPRSVTVGDLAGSASSVAECARLAGLEVRGVRSGSLEALAQLATRERWSVLSIPGDAIGGAGGAALRPYLATGGTVLVTGLRPDMSDGLAGLADELGASLPICRWLSQSGSGVRFSEQEVAWTRELAGVGFASPEADACLTNVPGPVLAWTEHAGRSWPLVRVAEVGGGRIVLSTGESTLRSRTEEKWGYPLALLVPLMVLRMAYGEAAWHAPWALANFVMDDPTLDRGPLGLDYERVVAVARAHDFHLTVATIPRELGLADPRVVDLLRREARYVSACYHGNDHDSYEFFLELPRHRFPARSRADQTRKLAQAAARGTAFARRTGLALDRVMVFPHGLCGADLIPCLDELGFLATCNDVDRYPLGSGAPADDEAGARPADLSWSGFPLLGRRPVGAGGELALDLFLGKPAVAFTHRKEAGQFLGPFVDRAAELNRIGGGRIRWAGLEEVARHAYLVRRAAGDRWDVLMTSNEACLHNEAGSRRRFRVLRPRLGAGAWLEATGDGVISSDLDGDPSHAGVIDIEVPASGTVEVAVRGAGKGARLPRAGRGRCGLDV